jgi:hypothetical protein
MKMTMHLKQIQTSLRVPSASFEIEVFDLKNESSANQPEGLAFHVCDHFTL